MNVKAPVETTDIRVQRKRHWQIDEVTIQVMVMSSLLVMVVLLTGWYDPNFFSAFSIRSVLRDTATWSLFALGQAVVIISGGIDLSVGSLMCFLGVFALLLLGPIPWPLSLVLGPGPLPLLGIIPLVILLAISVGVWHGQLVCRLGLQPFLVTLCSLLTLRGLARVITHDKTVSFSAKEVPLLHELGSGAWLGIPVPVYILIAVMFPLGLFMHGTVSGRYLYAIGYNVEAARFSGVRVNLLRTVSYMICGFLTALAALLEAGDVKSVPPSSAGMAYEMYGITGAVLGGCALRGGQGSLIGVVIGMGILRVIKSAVVFLGISTYWTFTVTGVVLLAAVIADSVIRRRKMG
ncbi:MAG: ABC transporter permease [Pirellulales bacterium]|nr:ABC transporter permease [Pirellulales bacterium]